MSKLRKVPLLIIGIILLSVLLTGCLNPKLTTVVVPSGAGYVNPSSGEYQKGVVVDVSAVPEAGYRFDHWEGAASGTSPTLKLVMNGTNQLVSYFKKVYTLSTSTTPSNGGSISPESGTYDEGKTVTVIATPNQYFEFNGWAGDVSGSSDQLSVTLDSNKNVVATFVKKTITIQTQVSPVNGGTISPGSGTFEAGNQVKFSATPASGYRFDHWGGSATGTNNTTNVLIDNDSTPIIAYFTKIYTLAVSVNGEKGGTTAVNPTGSIFDDGISITIIANPVFPYAFKKWVGADKNSSNPTIVKMNSNKNVTAYFVQLTKKTQTPVQKSGTTYGTDYISIDLKQGEWIDGNLESNDVLRPEYVIFQGPDGKTIKDLGNTGHSVFQIRAPVTGKYTVALKANGINQWGTTYFLNYTIYGMQ